MIAAPVRLWAMHRGPHLLQGPQTLAPGPTRRQHGRLRREGEASIRLLGRRWQVLGTAPVAAWREQAGAGSDASWAPAQGAAWLCTSDPLKGRPNWARALLHTIHPHAPGPWPPRKTRGQKPARGKRPHIVRSLPCRTYREGTHGAVQHELVVKHREGQDHIASDFLIAEHRKVTASFRAEPIQAEREQEGFLSVPHFQGERQGQLLPRGRMADVMGSVPRMLIQIRKARAHTEQCSNGLRRFLEAGHVQPTKKARARCLQHA